MQLRLLPALLAAALLRAYATGEETDEATNATIAALNPAFVSQLKARMPADIRAMLPAASSPAPTAHNASSSTPHTEKLVGDYTGYLGCGIDIRSGYSLGQLSYMRSWPCYYDCASLVDNCDAVVRTTWQDGSCFFKSNTQIERGVPNSIAATIKFIKGKLPPFVWYELEGEYDMPGFDIGNQRAPNLDACAGPCERNAACWAWTWTNFNGGTCWFKSQAADKAARAGAHSGIAWRDFVKAEYTCKLFPYYKY